MHLIVANLFTETIGLNIRNEIYLFILNVWRCEIRNYYTVSAVENRRGNYIILWFHETP
jgi:hypothetical protein